MVFVVRTFKGLELDDLWQDQGFELVKSKEGISTGIANYRIFEAKRDRAEVILYDLVNSTEEIQKILHFKKGALIRIGEGSISYLRSDRL